MNDLILVFLMIFFLLQRKRVRRFFFFFQAEDGIRDRNVTGVQTCALPISRCRRWYPAGSSLEDHAGWGDGLIATLGHERLAVIAVELREPLGHVGHKRLQQDPTSQAANTDAVPGEAELLGQADSLAPAVAEQFGDGGLCHGSPPATRSISSPPRYRLLVYTIILGQVLTVTWRPGPGARRGRRAACRAGDPGPARPHAARPARACAAHPRTAAWRSWRSPGRAGAPVRPPAPAAWRSGGPARRWPRVARR